MDFPSWVDAPTEKKLRAANRLRFLIYNAAHQISDKPSIRMICEKANIDHSTLACALRVGRISKSLAHKLNKGAGVDEKGNDLLPLNHLLEPLKIGKSK